jgi:hypothetical protein
MLVDRRTRVNVVVYFPRVRTAISRFTGRIESQERKHKRKRSRYLRKATRSAGQQPRLQPIISSRIVTSLTVAEWGEAAVWDETSVLD